MERRRKPPLAESRNFSGNYHKLVEKFQQMLDGSLPVNLGLGSELTRLYLSPDERLELLRKKGLKPPNIPLRDIKPVCEIFVGSSVEWIDSQ